MFLQDRRQTPFIGSEFDHHERSNCSASQRPGSPAGSKVTRRLPLRPSGSPRHGSHTVRERGAAVVEFALVLPLLVGLILGAVDMGFYLNDASKLRSAVREAARRTAVGAYGNTQCPSSYDQGNPATFTSPLPRAAETSKVICLAKLFAYESGLDAQVATRVVSFDALGSVEAGRDKPFDNGNAIVLCAQVLSHSRTGFLGPLINNRLIQSRVTMRITDSVLNGPGEANEASFGGNWSDCEVTQ